MIETKIGLWINWIKIQRSELVFSLPRGNKCIASQAPRNKNWNSWEWNVGAWLKISVLKSFVHMTKHVQQKVSYIGNFRNCNNSLKGATYQWEESQREGYSDALRHVTVWWLIELDGSSKDQKSQQCIKRHGWMRPKWGDAGGTDAWLWEGKLVLKATLL